MRSWSKIVALAAAGILSTLVAGSCTQAAEINVVASAGPLPDVLGTLVPMFEKASGHQVKISHKGGSALIADVKNGAVDLVVTGTEVIDGLAQGGDLGNGKTLLMISKVGVAVKAGAPKPDIGTADKLKA